MWTVFFLLIRLLIVKHNSTVHLKDVQRVCFVIVNNLNVGMNTLQTAGSIFNSNTEPMEAAVSLKTAMETAGSNS